VCKKKGKKKDPALTKKKSKNKSLVENSKRLTNKKNGAVKKNPGQLLLFYYH